MLRTLRHSTPSLQEAPQTRQCAARRGGVLSEAGPWGLEGAERPPEGGTHASCSHPFWERAFFRLTNLMMLAPKDRFPVNSHHKIPVKITSVDN